MSNLPTKKEIRETEEKAREDREKHRNQDIVETVLEIIGGDKHENPPKDSDRSKIYHDIYSGRKK